MKFRLIDTVVERSDDRIVAVKQVTAAEEYLADHFPGFPVLPGVFMLEALVQAARELLGERGGRMVLGQVRAMRYGSFVRPGEVLRVEVRLDKDEDGTVTFRGTGAVLRPANEAAPGPDTAVSGRFTMRPLRTAVSAPASA